MRGQHRQEIDELWTDVGVTVRIIALSNKQVSVNFLFCLCIGECWGIAGFYFFNVFTKVLKDSF